MLNVTINVKSAIAETWNTLMQPDQVVELRVLKVDGKKRTDSGYFDNPYALAEAAARYNGRANVYITPNGVERSLLSRSCNKMKEWVADGDTTSDLYIERRYWLLIDTDPRRASGISATEEEHQAALERAAAIREWLTNRGWTEPVAADSGNGGHLNYRIDQPNTPEVSLLIKSCLQVLALYFDDDKVSVDTGNFNAARIWKLYGTMAVKGDDTPERPHRLSRILSVPETTQIVTSEQLQGLAELLPPAETAPARTNGRYIGEPFDLEAWLAKHSITGQKAAWNSGTRWRLDKCPFSTAHDDGAFVVRLANGAIAAGCKHNSCQGKKWHDLRAIYDGPKEERGPKVYTNGSSKKAATVQVDPATGEIKSKADTWLDALRVLGHTFKLSTLEDMVEIDGKRLDDITRSRLYLDMVSRGVSKNYVDDCINVLAAENAYHPVQDYLNSLQWDGRNHLGIMLGHITGDGKKITYSDGDQPLHAALIPRWLIGCVARALDGDKEHAFKHQTPMLVFVGSQGIGKSSWVRWLVSGIGYEFHRESALDPHHPDHVRSAVTKWIWEVSELGASLRKGDRDALKGFITQEWFTYRKPWGKSNITKPVLANYVGTINPEIGFLDDPTGHRRFLPVTITAIKRDYEKAVDVNQLWAQVVHLYRTGTTPELSDPERQALAGVYAEHEVENPLQTYLQMYFKIDPGNTDLKCFTAEIIQRLQAFDVNLSNNPKVAGREINDALAPMKLERKFLSINGIKNKGWIGIAPNDKKEPI